MLDVPNILVVFQNFLLTDNRASLQDGLVKDTFGILIAPGVDGVLHRISLR